MIVSLASSWGTSSDDAGKTVRAEVGGVPVDAAGDAVARIDSQRGDRTP
ncbi:MAG TPA: hypothetical protein VM262_06935 [Acidimicrobiales bacterium]|nr:hypothetical protein [Acidimicrobiales bacterium]